MDSKKLIITGKVTGSGWIGYSLLKKVFLLFLIFGHKISHFKYLLCLAIAYSVITHKKVPKAVPSMSTCEYIKMYGNHYCIAMGSTYKIIIVQNYYYAVSNTNRFSFRSLFIYSFHSQSVISYKQVGAIITMPNS